MGCRSNQTRLEISLLSPDLLAETDFDKFRTSLGAALQFLKHQNDDNMDWLKDQERMKSLDRATADFIQTTTGTNLHLEDDEEVIDMCKAWKNSLKQAEDKGKASERINSIRNVMKTLDVTVTRAMEILCIPVEEQKKYISMV